MKQRESERMWLRQSVGQKKKWGERERERKRERGSDDRKGGWRSQESVGAREGEHYIQ